MKTLFFTTFVVLLLGIGAIAAADIVHLKDGRKLEGEIIGDPEKDETVTIKMKYGAIKVNTADILKIEKKRTKEQTYREKAQKIGASDAQGHFDLAMWCRENNLTKEMKQQLKKALEIDPGHENAHLELGHVLYEGKWLTPRQLKAKGLVRRAGKWVPAESPENKEPEDPLARGKDAFRRGDWKTAVEALEEFLKKPAGNADTGRAGDLLSLARMEYNALVYSGTSASIVDGLLWLDAHQDEKGCWDLDAFHKNCDGSLGAACDGNGISSYDLGVTSLALLAFMRQGHTHRFGLFKETVKPGLDWLVSQQQANGLLGRKVAEQWIYSHAIGTIALCEAYALTKDNSLKTPCEKAVDFILKAQNPGSGWKYEPRCGQSDTSVTSWMVSALHAARTAGIAVPGSAFKGALNWLDKATNDAGKTGYMRPGDDGSVIRQINEHFAKLPTMTAAAVASRIFCGQPGSDPKISGGVQVLMANLPDWNRPKNDKVDFYYWYYGTVAMSSVGGEHWNKWKRHLKKALLECQRIGGCAHGSWDPVGKWSAIGGRVYSTSINVLSLQLTRDGKDTPPEIDPGSMNVRNLAGKLKGKNLLASVAAARALGKTGDKKAVLPLTEALKHKVWLVRKNAAVSLGEIGDERAVEHLKKAWKEDEERQVQVACAFALVKIGNDRDALRFLVEALKDKDLRVRWSAAVLLIRATGENFSTDYQKWKEWYEKNKNE